MSLDGYLFFDRGLTSIAEWQKAIDALDFPLVLASDRDLRHRSGYLPAWLNGREAGFECGSITVDEVRQTYDDVAFGGPWTAAMVFHCASLPACVGAWLAMAAWVSVTDGAAFDPQRGVVLDARSTVRYARDGLEALPRVERQLRESGLSLGP